MSIKSIAATAAAVIAFSATSAAAQTPAWSAEQKAVWTVIEQSWVDDVAQNGKWPGDYADAQIVAWSADFPSPRTKESMIKWGRFEATQGKVLQYEIALQAIALSGNTAVVAYTLVMVREDSADKKTHRAREGVVETLVRSGSGWKFLATTGFGMGK